MYFEITGVSEPVSLQSIIPFIYLLKCNFLLNSKVFKLSKSLIINVFDTKGHCLVKMGQKSF